MASGVEGERKQAAHPTSPALLGRQLPRLQGYLKGSYFQLQSLPKWVCGPLQAPPCLFWACAKIVRFLCAGQQCSDKYDSGAASHPEHDLWHLTSAGQAQASTRVSPSHLERGVWPSTGVRGGENRSQMSPSAGPTGIARNSNEEGRGHERGPHPFMQRAGQKPPRANHPQASAPVSGTGRAPGTS